MRKLLCLLLILGVAACAEKKTQLPDNLLTHNDFEQLDGWMGSDQYLASLTTDQAHSGKYSAKVDPAVEFSAGYSKQLGKVAAQIPKKIKLQAWVNLSNEKAVPVLVTELKQTGTDKQLLWDGLDLAKEVKHYNMWVQVEKTVNLPAEAAYGDVLKVYLWRGGSIQPAYVDDLMILNEK
ncbi:carbohydrate binding domain-containing protein [Hymenobacter crusticola]|uniref:carbohydrate binding domain-containing protein n=1 Tax=Hymenobacter crusticola TaxID=1770526 RepID=UPI001179C536|nr:carbohydrate binding domain-containing protein [Hymenobacter crusticola]